MKKLGCFTAADAEGSNPHGILYLKNEDGIDWYDLKQEQGIFVVVDQGNHVSAISDDITTLFPADATLYQLEDEVTPSHGDLLVDGAFEAVAGV